MTVIFDEENAISFFKNLDNYEIGDDIHKLLKRQINLQFNFELDEIDEALELQILEFIETGGRKENELNIIFIKKIDLEETFCIDDINNNNNVYLLRTVTKKVKQANKVLIGEVGEEIEVLKKLFLNQTQVSIQENIRIGGAQFKSWDDIEIYNRPFSSIVIVDRYMFKGSTVGGNLGLFEFNLKKILGALFKNQTQRPSLTFIYQINPFVDKLSEKYDEGPDLQSLKQKIKSAVKSINKYCPEPNINFIPVPKGKIGDEHDRHIITNYLRIKSGDTLIYFNKNQEIITTSNEFDIYSLAQKQYRDSTQNLVTKLNEITNEVIQNFENRCLLSNPDKKENIINF
ncbi:hypothetical protein [Winogradskyella sp. Asnod2-B02-A]|uniref:hypothetical protein n=1 Tax=Winogradskyella sp. Asnod2-B02-A TaxID=3160583 RepID=UPI00386F2030